MKKESQWLKVPSSNYVYKTVFIPRLIYNCEAWSNLTPKDYLTLQTSQLTYLRNVPEVSKATPIAAMYFELGIPPVKYEIEKRQLLFLKRILDKSMMILVYLHTMRCLNLRMKQIGQINMYLVYGETISFPE